MTGAELTASARVSAEVLQERLRQVEQGGWNTAHDDEHNQGELALAAASYAAGAGAQAVALPADTYMGPLWPWGISAWRPKGARRDLIRAAALILAEIERLDRAGAPR